MRIKPFHLSTLLICLLQVTTLQAANTYTHALALRETDPIEAEALLARFVKETGSDKLRRAARYDLFFLRLRNFRLVEAFAQGETNTFRRRYREAVSLRLNLQAKRTQRLIANLAKACAEKQLPDTFAAYFAAANFGAAVYEFAIRVMENCGIAEAADVLAPEIWAEKSGSERQLALKLLKIRYNIEDAALAAEQVANVAALDADLLAAKPALNAQYILLQARVALGQGDLAAARARCKALVGPQVKSLRQACRFLVAFQLAENEQFAEAYQLVLGLEITPQQIDYRLMRLTLAVADKRVSVSRLQKFSQRASYRYSAASVRALAEKIIAGENKSQH